MSIGSRLKEERERLGLSQTALGAIGDFGKTTVIAWERGTAFPNALFLSDIAEMGADVQYIVTGTRQGRGIGESAVHQAVLDAADLLSLEKKIDAKQLAKAVAKLCVRSAAEPEKSGTKSQSAGRDAGTFDSHASQQINAPVRGGVAGRDLVHKGRKKKNEAGDQQ